MDESIYQLNAECDAMEREVERLESENDSLRSLCGDAIELLNVFCSVTDDSDCPAWPARDEQCLLRGIEERARTLGIEVEG